MSWRRKLGFHKIKIPSTFHPNDLEATINFLLPYFMPYGNSGPITIHEPYKSDDILYKNSYIAICHSMNAY